jgi:uncharacterized protein (TIGR03083 family)
VAYKDELLQKLDEGFAAFKKDLEGLNEEQMMRPWLDNWNTRDLLSHVAGWHREMSGALERMGRGERPAPEGVDYSDADSWNAKFSGAAASTAPSEVLRELDASFQAFRSAAAALGEDRFEQGRTVDRMVHTTGIHHYTEHGEQIREWRKNL